MGIIELPNPLEFEWDDGNKTKSYLKHGITNQEAEEVFINLNFIQQDLKHTTIGEERFNILGKCNSGKTLFSCFTLRKNKLRIISSRPASHKERNSYEKAAQENASAQN